MSGIERLRAFARRMDELSVWPGGTKLLDIADQIEREHDAEVADSPHDAITDEDRDTIAWVREHGGLDHVRAEWRSRVPYDRYERRRQNLLRHIAECETALGRRRERISELGHRVKDLTNENAELRRRAMPDGCEWPRYESGDLVMFGDCVENRNGTCTVNSVRFYSGGGVSVYGEGRGAQFVVVTEPVMRDPIRKARPKVLAADGEPLEVGQTVWDALGNRRFKVLGFSSDAKLGEFTVKTVGIDGMSLEGYSKPSDLTHTKPEIDSWERIEEDALLPAGDYRERHGMEKRDGMTWSQQIREDLVRRCRALAERERGE